MKKFTALFILFCVFVSIAHGNNQKIAVYMEGKEPASAKGVYKILGSELAKAIYSSSAYSAVDRTDEILKQISKEQKYQRSGAVSDEQIKELGKQLGVQYICVVDVSEIGKDSYYITARLVDVETAEALRIASFDSGLEDVKEMIRIARRVAFELIAGAEGSAEMFYNKGLEQKDRKEAVVFFTEAINLKPNEAKYYYRRGLVNDEGDGHIADLTEAIRLKPGEAEYHSWRGLKYGLNCFPDRKYCDEAIADYTEAIRLNPSEAEYHFNRGNIRSYVNDYDKAIADYTEAIRIKPNEAKYYSSRGFKYKMKNEYDKAIADYKSALQINPNDADAKKELEDIQKNIEDNKKKQKKYNDEITEYTEKIRKYPNYAFNYSKRGRAYSMIKNYDKAIADYTKAIQLEPDYFSYYFRGKAYYEKKDYNKAIADFQAALRIEPNDELGAKEWLEKARNANR